MKIYTKSGDSGETSLFGGKRVLKSALRLEAYGTLDELNAILGVVACNTGNDKTSEIVFWLQNTLFIAGGDLAAPEDPRYTSVLRITEEEIRKTESYIDFFEEKIPELREFILPGGTPAAAHLHLARTVCRRAERCITKLMQEEEINKKLIIFINRLSDLFFVLARWENFSSGQTDTTWKK